MTTLFTPAGSWVALVTPMREDGNLDRDALRGLVDAHVEAGTSGIVFAGTTGESAALDDGEYAELLDAGLRAVDGRLPVLAGVGSPATQRAVSLARTARSSGVDGLLCVTPYYLRTTQRGLEAHYHALTEAVDLPIVLYNVPARTGNDLLPETTAALSRLETVVAIKEAVPDTARIARLATECADGFAVLSGDDLSSVDALAAGATGVISVTANVVPALLAATCRAAQQGDWTTARQLEGRLLPLHRGLMREPNPIPVKGLLARLGRIGPTLRLPLVPADRGLLDELENLINESFQTETI